MWDCGGERGARILVDASVLVAMNRYRQNSAEKTEAGGVLLGYRRGIHLHVTIATEPSNEDVRRRRLFERTSRVHQAIATDHWRLSGGTIAYLGEWHTHPEVHPSPSSLDFKEWYLICRQQRVPMIFVIVGVDGALWLGCSSRGGVKRCSTLSLESS